MTAEEYFDRAPRDYCPANQNTPPSLCTALFLPGRSRGDTSHLCQSLVFLRHPSLLRQGGHVVPEQAKHAAEPHAVEEASPRGSNAT